MSENHENNRNIGEYVEDKTWLPVNTNYLYYQPVVQTKLLYIKAGGVFRVVCYRRPV